MSLTHTDEDCKRCPIRNCMLPKITLWIGLLFQYSDYTPL